MRGARLTSAARGFRWYLRQATGEAKWDEYLDHCRQHGHEPMTRREFERARADRRENDPQSRCC
jgi:uncharacterized short protein YbdD (DUF466 family)